MGRTRRPLADRRPADLVVVGAGIAGLSIADEALQRRREVMILDRGPFASSVTARATAHLASALDALGKRHQAPDYLVLLD